MNNLVRSTTTTLSRRFDGYEPFDHHHNQRIMMRDERNKLGRRAFSKRSKKLEGHRVSNYSRSYRNERAKQRRIFLKTYKLAPVGGFNRRSDTRKLDKLVTKVKKAVVSVLSLIRIGSAPLRSCNCRLAISASTPIPMCRK